MSCVQSLWFLLVLVFSLIQSKEICDIVDVKCMTHAAINVFKTGVAGIEGLIEPMDPLSISDANGVVQDTKYTMSNLKMTGLKDCQVTQLAFQPDEVSFEYKLNCPLLVLNYWYEAKGTFDTLKLDGDGQVKVTLDNYLIILKGQTKRFISETDNKLRLIVKNFIVETEPKGKITFKIDNLVRGDTEKSDQVEAYANEHAMDLEKYLRTELIEKFMKVFIGRINIMFTTIPYEEMVPKI